MTRYLLDTNACIDFLLARSRPLAERIDAAFGRLTVSAVSVAELRVGKRTSTDPDADERLLDNFLGALAIAPFDEAAADRYGDMVRRIGMRRGAFDLLIAAQALALGLVLVTNNERDFADIPGLVVENWAR